MSSALPLITSILRQTTNATQNLVYIFLFFFDDTFRQYLKFDCAEHFGHARTSTFRRQQIEGKNPSYFTQTAQVMIQDPNIHFE